MKASEPTAKDIATLAFALNMDQRFQAGIFPRDGGQASHYKRLERFGMLEFNGEFGRDLDGEVERDVPLYQLTAQGRAWIERHEATSRAKALGRTCDDESSLAKVGMKSFPRGPLDLALPSLNLLEVGEVTLVVVHRKSGEKACPDGRASALLIADVLPWAEIREVAYGTKEHAELQLPKKGRAMFCDFTPLASSVDAFVESGAFCLDHHKSQEAIVQKFGSRGVFADEAKEPGASGAVLAFHEVWLPILRKSGRIYGNDQTVRDAYAFARLVGIRDTFQKQDRDFQRACEVSAVLQDLPFHYLMDLDFGSLLDLGEHLGLDLIAEVKRRVQKATLSLHEVAGMELILTPEFDLVSDLSDRALDEHPMAIVVGFQYRQDDVLGHTLELSLRSRGGFDVGAFAKKWGGGGHTRAAGCSIPVGARDPYTTILQRFQDAS